MSLGVFGQVPELSDSETSWKMHRGRRLNRVQDVPYPLLVLLLHEILGRRSEEEYVGAPWGHAVAAHWIYCTRSTRYSQLTTVVLAHSFILQSFNFFFPQSVLKALSNRVFMIV